METPHEQEVNRVMRHINQTGPPAMRHLETTVVYRDATLAGVPASGVAEFVFQLTFELAKEGFLRQEPEQRPDL